MFAVKVDLEKWCKEFLIKNGEGRYLCPFEDSPLEMIRVKGGWKIKERCEEWIWRVEDLKQGHTSK